MVSAQEATCVIESTWCTCPDAHELTATCGINIFVLPKEKFSFFSVKIMLAEDTR